jgi:hypothetical protein
MHVVLITRLWLFLIALQLTLGFNCRAGDAADFASYVNSLDTAKPDSVCQAASSVRTFKKPVGTWFECGFSTDNREGSLSLMDDSAPLLEFVKFISWDLGEYVRFTAKETRSE